MFGVSRKKTKPTRVRSAAASSSDSDDDDDGDDARRRLAQHQKKKKKKAEKKKKAGPMLSFDPDEGRDGDEGEAARKKSKKRKKHSKRRIGGGGMGFGGRGAMPTDASEGSASEAMEKEVDDEEGAGAGSYYDTAALEKLKSEQKRTTLPKKEDSVKPLPETPAAEEIEKDAKHGEKENAEEEYISLSGATSKHAADPMVLTGDEAMAFAERDEDETNPEFDHGLQSPMNITTSDGIVTEKGVTGKVADMDINADGMDVAAPSAEVEEGNRRWEDAMARRAGVLPPTAAATNGQGTGRPRPPQREGSSLSQLRASLQPTIANLGNIDSDLETSISRHQSTIASARDDLTKHQKTLQTHGQALEYYQGLREDLATWLGALRELNGMVERAEGAKRQLDAEVSWRRMERFREWGRDCTEVLERQGLVETTVGGDATEASDVPAQVDEFGRDVASMASMARVRRWNQRRKRRQTRQRESHGDDGELDNPLQRGMDCSNEDNIGDDEMEEWRKRQEALSQALGIIPSLVADDYLSVSKLCRLFFDWQRLYPEDYASCYAEMSLVQMASVLVRLEMCDRWDFLLDLRAEPTGSLCLEVSEFKWFGDLKESIAQRDANDGGDDKAPGKSKARKDILLEVVQKQVVDRLLESLTVNDGVEESNKRHIIYDPFSVDQTKRLCTILKSVMGYFTSRENGRTLFEETAEKVLGALVSLIKHCLQKMSVPIVDGSKITLATNEFAPKDGSKDFDGETADAIAYATIVQTEALCTLVDNILGHWYPIISQAVHDKQKGAAPLVQFVFADLVSDRILPILHALHDISAGGTDNDAKYSGMPSKFVGDVLGSLEAADLLDKDEWMLMAAPLRAVAKRWNVTDQSMYA